MKKNDHLHINNSANLILHGHELHNLCVQLVKQKKAYTSSDVQDFKGKISWYNKYVGDQLCSKQFLKNCELRVILL